MEATNQDPAPRILSNRLVTSLPAKSNSVASTLLQATGISRVLSMLCMWSLKFRVVPIIGITVAAEPSIPAKIWPFATALWHTF